MAKGVSMTAINDLLKDLEAFESTPESRGYDLRLDLAQIVLRHLKEKGWTQKALADAAGMKAPFLTRIIHAAQNCTFDVAGRLLFALGIRAKLLEVPTTVGTTEVAAAAAPIAANTVTGSIYHGQPSTGHDETTAVLRTASTVASTPILQRCA
jgi:plasmid maintenance system antidote protein VapI